MAQLLKRTIKIIVSILLTWHWCLSISNRFLAHSGLKHTCALCYIECLQKLHIGVVVSKFILDLPYKSHAILWLDKKHRERLVKIENERMKWVKKLNKEENGKEKWKWWFKCLTGSQIIGNWFWISSLVWLHSSLFTSMCHRHLTNYYLTLLV